MAAKIDISTLVHEVREIHERFPTWTLDNAFIHWFLYAFLVPDLEIAARSVTGVAHDKGCDGIYIDDNAGKVFILQGKLHRSAKPPQEPRTEIISFSTLARTLTGPSAEFNTYISRIDPAVGAMLKHCRQRLLSRHFELQLYYVTTGRCSAPLKTEAESVVSQSNGLNSLSVLDRSDVLSLLTDERWLRLSEQPSPLDKWIPAGVQSSV